MALPGINTVRLAILDASSPEDAKRRIMDMLAQYGEQPTMDVVDNLYAQASAGNQEAFGRRLAPEMVGGSGMPGGQDFIPVPGRGSPSDSLPTLAAPPPPPDPRRLRDAPPPQSEYPLVDWVDETFGMGGGLPASEVLRRSAGGTRDAVRLGMGGPTSVDTAGRGNLPPGAPYGPGGAPGNPGAGLPTMAAAPSSPFAPMAAALAPESRTLGISPAARSMASGREDMGGEMAPAPEAASLATPPTSLSNDNSPPRRFGAGMAETLAAPASSGMPRQIIPQDPAQMPPQSMWARLAGLFTPDGPAGSAWTAQQIASPFGYRFDTDQSAGRRTFFT